jgi:hypothetical protein
MACRADKVDSFYPEPKLHTEVAPGEESFGSKIHEGASETYKAMKNDGSKLEITKGVGKDIAFVATCAIPGGSETKIPKAIALVKDIVKIAKAANTVTGAVNMATAVINIVQYFEDNASKKS